MVNRESLYGAKRIRDFVRKKAGPGASVDQLKDTEKSVRMQLEASKSGPVRIKVDFFRLLDPGADDGVTETAEERARLVALMNNPAVKVTNIEFNMFEQPIIPGEPPAPTRFRTHYTVMVTYTPLVIHRRPPEYRMDVFELPGNEEELGEFLTRLGNSEVVTEGGFRYIKGRAVIRQDRIIDAMSGNFCLYYHTVVKYGKAEAVPAMEEPRAFPKDIVPAPILDILLAPAEPAERGLPGVPPGRRGVPEDGGARPEGPEPEAGVVGPGHAGSALDAGGAIREVDGGEDPAQPDGLDDPSA